MLGAGVGGVDLWRTRRANIDERARVFTSLALDRVVADAVEGGADGIPKGVVRGLADAVREARERATWTPGPVYEPLRTMYRAAGRSEEQADYDAAIVEAAIIQFTQRYTPDLTPEQFLREHGYEVRRGTPDGGQAAATPPPRPSGAAAGRIEQVDPDTVRVDAKRFQFKAGGDEAGVSERLQGVASWDPYLAGTVMIWEDNAGNRYIADGHQRLGLAKRLKAEGRAAGGGREIVLNAHVLREADGISDVEAMAIAAARNVAEGTGTAIDAAKVLRLAAKEKIELPPLPPRSALVRDGRALARLSDDAFGMVVNGIVPAHYAALVGRLVDGPVQVEALRLLARAAPENAAQADIIVRELLATGTELRTQTTLFGDEAFAASIVVERAQVLDTALKQVKRDKAAFAMLVKEGERLAETGNVLAGAANAERLSADEQAIELLTRVATRAGHISDALSVAARAFKSGGMGRGEAARSFLAAIRGADLAGLERRAGDGERVAGDAGAPDRPAGAAGEEAGAEGLAPEPDPNQQTLFQGPVLERTAPAFFSALTRAAEGFAQPKAPAKQWAGIIKNLTQRGVRQDEIAWSGVLDWLDAQDGPVSREDLIAYLRANEVQVHEVVKGKGAAVSPARAGSASTAGASSQPRLSARRR